MIKIEIDNNGVAKVQRKGTLIQQVKDIFFLEVAAKRCEQQVKDHFVELRE